MSNGRQQRLHNFAADLQAARGNRRDASRRSGSSRAWTRGTSIPPKDRESSPPVRDLQTREAREFLAPAFSHRLRQLSIEVAEKEEWRRRAPFLAHEQHRYLRREQVDARKRADRLRGRQRVQPFAKRAIADLVVILDEGDESVRRQFGARAAARRISIGHHLALVGEAFGDGFSQELRRAVGGVIAAALMRGGDMENMMNVVVPLRGVEIGLVRRCASGAAAHCPRFPRGDGWAARTARERARRVRRADRAANHP